jgi:hypothetical protein
MAASKAQIIPSSRAFIPVPGSHRHHCCGASVPKINYFFNVAIICQLRRAGTAATQPACPLSSNRYRIDATRRNGGKDGLNFNANVGVGPYSVVILSQPSNDKVARDTSATVRARMKSRTLFAHGMMCERMPATISSNAERLDVDRLRWIGFPFYSLG